MRCLATLGAFAAISLLQVPSAHAQLNGSHLLGDYGVLAGTQPAPGVYTALLYYRYSTDTIKGRNGQTVQPLPGQPGSIDLDAFAPLVVYVSRAKILGANYGAFVTFPFTNGVIEVPALSLGEKLGTKYTDMLIRPIELGWHSARADVTTGFQMYAPTGTYESGGSENSGKGMWTYEPYVGATAYFDEKKTVSASTTAYWEMHGEKKDTNVTVGQIVTLEGGMGKSFLGGGVVLGAAYYAQWKITADTVGSFVLPGGGTVNPTLADAKHKVFAFGPDVTLPVASRTKLFALVTIRYLWESGATSKTQGSTLVVMTTFPIPSLNISK